MVTTNIESNIIEESTYISLSLILKQGNNVTKYNTSDNSCIDCNHYIVDNKSNLQILPVIQQDTFLLFNVVPLPTYEFIFKQIENLLRRIFCRVKPLPCWGICGPYHHEKSCLYHPFQGRLPYNQVKRSLSMEF